MSIEEKRLCEEKLLNATEEIPFSRGKTDWITSDEFRNYLDSWKALREIYIIYDTFVDFSVEIIQDYRIVTDYLRKLLADPQVSPQSKDLLSDALDEIEFWMDELIKEALRNLNRMIEEEEDMNLGDYPP